MEGTAQLNLDILPPPDQNPISDRKREKGAVVVDHLVNRPELGRNAAKHMFDS
jgi:hypothetical protein